MKRYRDELREGQIKGKGGSIVLSELKDLAQKYGELKYKYDEILQLQREQSSFINRIINQLEKILDEIDRLKGN